MALMAARGEIGPMPDAAIFADTGWEPQAVYDHLAWMMSPGVLPFPVHIVSAGNIRDGLVAGGQGKRWASIPAFTAGGGLLRRQCTKDYKLVPLRRKVRELVGLVRKRSPAQPVVEQWIGISLDEAMRAKPYREAWVVNRFPLLEGKISRADCLAWMSKNGYPTPPKSACIGCPFHSDEMWSELKERSPAEFADAVEVDRSIRTGYRNMREELFLHRSLVPLDQVDFSPKPVRVKAAARELPPSPQLDMFINECEGMCGV